MGDSGGRPLAFRQKRRAGREPARRAEAEFVQKVRCNDISTTRLFEMALLTTPSLLLEAPGAV